MPVYFAYGSNLDPAQMARRCPGAAPLGVAVLANYLLDFTRASPSRGCGVADVVPQEGAQAFGVLWDVTDAHIRRLDWLEGHAPGVDAYRRVTMKVVRVADQEVVEAEVYEVARKVPFVRPSRAYLETILRGARHFGLPGGYVAQLAETPAVE